MASNEFLRRYRVRCQTLGELRVETFPRRAASLPLEQAEEIAAAIKPYCSFVAVVPKPRKLRKFTAIRS